MSELRFRFKDETTQPNIVCFKRILEAKFFIFFVLPFDAKSQIRKRKKMTLNFLPLFKIFDVT